MSGNLFAFSVGLNYHLPHFNFKAKCTVCKKDVFYKADVESPNAVHVDCLGGALSGLPPETFPKMEEKFNPIYCHCGREMDEYQDDIPPRDLSTGKFPRRKVRRCRKTRGIFYGIFGHNHGAYILYEDGWKSDYRLMETDW